MAKKFKELKNKKLSDSLTTQQKKAVEDAATYIDEQIDLQWENESIYIEHCIMTFECNPETMTPVSFPPDKKEIMQDLLFSIYYDADWDILPQFDLKWRLIPTKK